MTRDESIEQKRAFTNNELNTLLNKAKPRLRCEYAIGKNILLTDFDKHLIEDGWCSTVYCPDDEYVLIFKDDVGERYAVNIEGDTLIVLASRVMTFISELLIS